MLFNSYLIIPSIMINLFWCLPHLEGFKANTTSITLSNFLSVFGTFENCELEYQSFSLSKKKKKKQPLSLMLCY